MTNLWLKKFLKNLRLNESVISTFLGGLVVVVVGVLIYNYFSSVNKTAEVVTEPETVKLVEENGQLVPDKLPTKHTVMTGEDLWHISQKYYESGYNWVDIAKENQLVNANVITAGQELLIPRTAVKAVTKAAVASAESISASEYLVQKGDSLWKISVRAYGDGYAWTKIWEANKALIANPNLIEAGTLLKLPR